MDRYERRQFIHYIGGLREKQGFTMGQLCEGLCSDRAVAFIEQGKRDTARPFREAILERLGVGAEDYECYLGREEYAQWEIQQRILHAISYEKIGQAEELLQEYWDVYCVEGRAATEEACHGRKEKPGRKGAEGKGNAGTPGRKLEQQFYFSMLAQIRRYQRKAAGGDGAGRGDGSKECCSLFRKALELTVPSWEEKPLRKLALSIKELNLLLEAEHCRGEADDGMTGHFFRKRAVRYREEAAGTGDREGLYPGERPERYREVVDYITDRKMDRRGMAKIYPKAVYFLCRCTLVECEAEDGGADFREESLEKYRELMRYCNRALKRLRDNGRMYYLWEILDMREKLFVILGRASGGKNCGNGEAFCRLQQENAQWKQVLEEVYAEFRVPKETFHYCYLYTSKGVSCINEVIRIRSNMLGMKAADFEEICSSKTLWRIRRGLVTPHREIAEELFGKLGLPGELVRTELVTGVPEARELMERVREDINEHRWEEAEAALERIKQLVPMEMVCNRQAILRREILISRGRKEIDREEYYRRLREALELTFSYEKFLEPGEKYLTREEQSCIRNMMAGMDKESEEFLACMRQFEEMYQSIIDREELENVDGLYEFVMGYIRSNWGDMGCFDKADKQDSIIIEGCLRNKRLKPLHDSFYDRWWNYTERKKKGIPTDVVLNDAEELNKCIILGRLVQSRESLFYQRKLEAIIKGTLS